MSNLSRTAFPSTRRGRASRPDSSHQLSIRHCSVDSIRLDPLNPRVHTDKQIQQIANSIRNFGFNVPILIDQKRNIIAGHGRFMACKLLGITEAPTISLNHLSSNQVRAFMIADNKLTENSSWNELLLGEQLKALSEVELDFTLDAIGLEMAEIDILIEGLAPAGGDAHDSTDNIPIETTVGVTQSGDLWELGQHRLLCGDALNSVNHGRLMGDQLASIVFTDPPYNVRIDGHASGLGKKRHHDFQMASGEMSRSEFTDFLNRMCKRLIRSSRDGAIHFICMDWRHVGELLEGSRDSYEELKNICVWVKDNAGMGSLYRSQHEFILVFKQGKSSHRNNVQLGQFGRYRTNVWNYPGANSFSRSTSEGNLLALHPTVKPVALVADAIMDASARGEIVLDPFLGSGTTVIAAERTGRVCYGIEIGPKYVDIAVRRWQAFTGLKAKDGLSGRTFNELEKEAGDEFKEQ
jgi:DNA modification methylase